MTEVAMLSFTAQYATEERIDRWAPAPASTWDSDCREGRGYAREAVEYMGKTGDFNLVAAIARRILERAEFGGAEVGFFTALAELATAGVGTGNVGDARSRQHV